MGIPGIILLTQCYYHRGTRLNAMKRFCICSLLSHLNVLTFFPLTGGCSEGLGAFSYFFKKKSTICIAWLHLQGHFIFICFAPVHVHPCPCNVRISAEYLYSEHAPKSLCCCSTEQERLRIRTRHRFLASKRFCLHTRRVVVVVVFSH